MQSLFFVTVLSVVVPFLGHAADCFPIRDGEAEKFCAVDLRAGQCSASIRDDEGHSAQFQLEEVEDNFTLFRGQIYLGHWINERPYSAHLSIRYLRTESGRKFIQLLLDDNVIKGKLRQNRKLQIVLFQKEETAVAEMLVRNSFEVRERASNVAVFDPRTRFDSELQLTGREVSIESSIFSNTYTAPTGITVTWGCQLADVL